MILTGDEIIIMMADLKTYSERMHDKSFEKSKIIFGFILNISAVIKKIILSNKKLISFICYNNSFF